MDLGAYAQIEDLEKIMEENGISVPRLRGIRLMKDEKALTDEEIEKYARRIGLNGCAFAVLSNFQYDPYCFEMSGSTDRLKRKYIVYKRCEKGYKEPVNIRWDRIHGYKRKLFKYVIKQARKKSFEMWNTFNKYCGRDDVLYIHARIGGENWHLIGKK